jgi:protein TonB
MELKRADFGVRQTQTQEAEGAVTLSLVIVTPETPAPVVTAPPKVQPPPKEEPVTAEPVVLPAIPFLPMPAPEPPASQTISAPAPAITVKPEVHVPAKNISAPAPPSTVEAKPNYLRNPPPLYPEAARRKHQDGLVILAVTVTPEGQASRVSIKKSSGFPILDNAAVQAVQNWEFQPARLGPLALESQIEIPVHFELTGR